MNEEYSGILFTLKKRMQAINMDDSPYYQYQMLGYYDGLEINVVDKWYDLRPRGLQTRNLQVNPDLPFIDQYTIRAILPQNRNELNSDGFCYSFWESVGKHPADIFETAEPEIRKKYPYITMSVVNLSESYVKESSNLLSLQSGIIYAIKDKLKCPEDLQDLHCAIFPSIGYSDFVILCMTDNLKKSSNIIEALRGAHSPNGNVIISNCYSICGLDKIYYSDTVNLPSDNDVKVTIRINLKEGIAPNYFFHALKEKIHNDVNNTSNKQYQDALKIFFKEIEDYYYVTFGNSDCLILSEKSLPLYLRLHAPGQALNPETEFFKQYITNVRTSVRVKGASYDAPGQHRKGKRDLSHYRNAFAQFIDAYEKFLTQSNMPIRSSKAMQQIMQNFLNISYAGHSFDVAHVLGNAFLSLFQNMNFYINKIPPHPDDTPEKEQSSIQDEIDYIESQKYESVEALSIFKDNIGVLIADLTRSDRPFFEGNTLTHPSIGSATKLMFAYTAILKRIAARFHASDKFTFVVASGGCDKTQAIDLFSFASPNDAINKLIFIKIPEMSLYDIQGTLFRLLHECMHFIGERKRKDRYHHLICALSYAIAWDMVESDFSPKTAEQLTRVIDILPEKEKALFSNYQSDKFDELSHNAVKEIAETIATHIAFSEYAESKNESDYYAEAIQQTILSSHSMINILKTPMNGSVCLQKQLYNILYALNKKRLNAIVEYFHSRNPEAVTGGCDPEDALRLNFVEKPYIMVMQNFGFMDSNPQMRDVILDKYIMRYMEASFNQISYYQEDDEYICEYPFEEIRDSLISSMVEGFSDCGAISCLKMELTDFLLAFIYEAKSIDYALPLTIVNILRLGADLKVMFHIEGELSSEIQCQIMQKVNLRHNQGFTYHNATDMINRVNILLKKYASPRYDNIRNEIEDYLRSCFENAEWTIESLVKLYEDCNWDSSSKIYSAVDEIFKQWKSLCEVTN